MKILDLMFKKRRLSLEEQIRRNIIDPTFKRHETYESRPGFKVYDLMSLKQDLADQVARMITRQKQ